MRTAIITVICDVIEVGRGDTVTTRSLDRKVVVPLDVATCEGAQAFGKELALAIREAAILVGVTPNEMLQAVCRANREQIDNLLSKLAWLRRTPRETTEWSPR